MPTIQQLPTPFQAASPSDVLIVQQNEVGGSTPGANIVVQMPVSSVLALVPAMGAATTVPALPSGIAPVTTDNVVMVQGGTADLVPYSQFLNANTITDLAAAGPAGSTDTLMVGQGTNVLTRQTLGAVWTWLQTQIPAYKFPVIEVTANTTIDATFNGKILIVSASGVTLTARI
jgi:hypothetical protein